MKTSWLCLLMLALVLAAYANHFDNGFHFDDFGAITHNPAIHEIGNILKAFRDPALFSVITEQRTYRPVLLASLIADYALGGGLNPFYFHLTTFIWYSLQLLLMFLLFQRIMDAADPHPVNRWTAFFAAALYGLHPVMAETVNYIVQRADLYNTLGCVAGLWLFIQYPRRRKFGLYLLPGIVVVLAKPPAMVFPGLLLLYVLLFEPRGERLRPVVVSTLAVGAVALFVAHMQPATWKSNAPSPLLYRFTQPYVSMQYFRSFFWPSDLSIDAGWRFLPSPWSALAIAGCLFVAAACALAMFASKTRSGKPIAFGIGWFFVTLLPVALFPLADITNDHRMFFPFVGLTLAVVWALRLTVVRLNRKWQYATATVAAAVLLTSGVATHIRNGVWATEETVWRDATEKNPRNARAWTNYGAYFFEQADYETALPSWERAAALDPANVMCQTNLAHVYVQLKRNELAERQFRKLIEMDLPAPGMYIVYADWLRTQSRPSESLTVLQQGSQRYPNSPEVQGALQAYYLEREAAK